ncbi:MAG: isoprenoid biosynthesis glyoxalase ElbB [Bacteroidales bacterium]|nr:isoprenoid biosynthesis glyoxalase ElbB [Bacteroidales bacterium]
MQKVAVVLAGSGVYDGSEIHEAVLSLYALNKHGIEYDCFAPNINQHHVINHLNGEEMPETRNVLVESGRIARGNIKALNELNSKDYAAVVFPGGFGAAKNLSNYAFKGSDLEIIDEVEKTIKDFHSNKKPILALCIAPVLVAKAIGAEVTIGSDQAGIENIQKMGGTHLIKKFDEVAVDAKNKVITTPCYMLASNIYETAQGIENAVIEMKKYL